MLRLSVILLSLVAVAVAEQTQVDSTARARPQSWPERASWEQVVAFPGEVAYAPFGVLFAGVESFLAYQERTRFLQRVRDRFVWDDGRRAVLPAVESRSGVGLAYADREWLEALPRLQVGIMGGFRRRHGLLLAAAGDRVRLEFDLRRRPDEAFWGIGPETPDRDQTRYERLLAIPAVEVVLAERRVLRLVGRVALEFDDLGDGSDDDYPDIADRFGPAQVTGMGGREWFAVGAFTIVADSRDRPGATRGGGLGFVRGEGYHELSAGDFDFVRLTGELVRYHEVWSGRVVLARVGGAAVFPVGGGRVPFYHLAQIGDEATTIRGFDRGRYRDRQALYGGVEYRWPVWRVIDGVAFVNAGQVGHSLPGDFDADHVHHSWGGGLRLWRDSGVASRVLVSRSQQRTFLQFFLSSSF